MGWDPNEEKLFTSDPAKILAQLPSRTSGIVAAQPTPFGQSTWYFVPGLDQPIIVKHESPGFLGALTGIVTALSLGTFWWGKLIIGTYAFGRFGIHGEEHDESWWGQPVPGFDLGLTIGTVARNIPTILKTLEIGKGAFETAETVLEWGNAGYDANAVLTDPANLWKIISFPY